MNAIDRFLAKVEKTDTCWTWTAATLNGYGRFYDGTKVVCSHRFSYEQYVGPIPEGLVIDHLCRNHGCVNPQHLEPVTHRENLLRGVGFTGTRSRQTHCEAGHELIGSNLYIKPNGCRNCRECRREANRQAYARKIARVAA